MIQRIAEIRILPPFAIARLGSSPDPMDNYEFAKPEVTGYRRIVPTETLVVDRKSGNITGAMKPSLVNFRDGSGRIRPVAPFFEVWVRIKGRNELVPLTQTLLKCAQVRPGSLRWNIKVVNAKTFRRTGEAKDRILAEIKNLQDHHRKKLEGRAENFLPNKKIVLGEVQYIRPNKQFPEVRLRFTPAFGQVFGPISQASADIPMDRQIYDPQNSPWATYKDDRNDPKTTLPPETYARDSLNQNLGYLDDICDGIIEFQMEAQGSTFSAYARIAVGPPDFAPDSLPVRTFHDELEQAMSGPEVRGKLHANELNKDVRDIVRRSVETIRLINIRFWNGGDVGVAQRDKETFSRAVEPIMDPEVADALAVRSRHERVLLALESGTLAWFARVLRRHDKVNDLSTDERRKMPALLRGADGRHLALTRRQVNKVWVAAELASQPKETPKK
ncbi:MAG TPA: hypothetical protein VFC07_01240 [Verrucomicrobiae bacterium]|nr:hypothetical protein [Verrucomicrobiae bacterium]